MGALSTADARSGPLMRSSRSSRCPSRPTRAAPSAGATGQSTVELVAFAPLVIVIVLAAAQLLAAGLARELAANAAEAGAVALLQHEDPSAAARAAVPGWSRHRIAIHIAGRRVTVGLRPPALFPVLASMLRSSRHADAGPLAR